MKVLLLLLLASASTVYGKSLPESNQLLWTVDDLVEWDETAQESKQHVIGESSEADEAASHENDGDEPSSVEHWTVDDLVEWDETAQESEQHVIGKSSEADEAASHENDGDEPSSVEHERKDYLVESDDNASEAGKNVNEESNEVDLVASPEIAEDEPSPIEHEEEEEHLLSSDEWLQGMRDDYDWIVKNRLRDSEEQGYYGDRNGFDSPRYDYNPSSSWRLGHKGPIVVQPIVIPVQFSIGQQDYYRRRFMY